MGIGYGVKIPQGMCFCFDALNSKCYSGTGTTFTDIISGVSTNAIVTSSLSMDSTLGSPHLKFTPGATTRTAYIPFPSANLNLPRGTTGTWSFWSYFQDQGSIDHPTLGWETGSGWDGLNGWVFGTGWGTDGPRFGINDNKFLVSGGYQNNVWQHWIITFKSNTTNGMKAYRNGSLYTQINTGTQTISPENTNTFNIGATNSRGGNWGGYLDIVQIWDRDLSENEIISLHNIQKGRFGL